MILPYRTHPQRQTWTDYWRSERGAWTGLGQALATFLVLPIVAYIAWMAVQSIL